MSEDETVTRRPPSVRAGFKSSIEENDEPTGQAGDDHRAGGLLLEQGERGAMSTIEATFIGGRADGETRDIPCDITGEPPATYGCMHALGSAEAGDLVDVLLTDYRLVPGDVSPPFRYVLARAEAAPK